MLQPLATHPHKTRSKAKATRTPMLASHGQVADQSEQLLPPQQPCPELQSSTSNESASMAMLLGLDSNLNIQEAFGTLLNVHDILGASHDALSEEAEGELAFRTAYEKLYHPTPSVSGSLGQLFSPD